MPRKLRTALDKESYTDGVAMFYGYRNVGKPGDMPKSEMVPMFQVPFSERSVSDKRYFDAKQSGIDMVKLIRTPLVEGLQPSGDICVVSGSERQFEVKKVSYIRDRFSMDVTLALSEKTYRLRSFDHDNGTV